MRPTINLFFTLILSIIGATSCSNRVTSTNGSNSDEPIAGTSGSTIRQMVRKSFDTLTVDNYILDTTYQDQLFSELKRFYRFSNYNLRWCTGKGTNEETRDLLNVLTLADDHGLNPALYNVDHLISLIDKVYTYNFNAIPEDIVQLDVSLTAAYLSYAWHLYNGMVDPTQIQKGWQKANENTEIAQYFAGKSLQESLEMIEPDSDEYDLLRKRLETYISISKEGGWPTLADTINLRPGDYDDSVYDIRDRLSYSNDLGVNLSGGRGSGVYEGKLVDAVKSFQRRHGLNDNGIIDKETIDAMNISVDYRIAQMKINLERLRWMPREMDDKYLLVNVPEFKLRIYRKNKVVDDMRVIVGRIATPTPMVNSKIDYVIMSPTWAVPNQIFNESVLPKVKEDPTYLENAGYKLYASLDGNNETLIDAATLKWNEMDVIQNNYRIIRAPSPSDEKKGGIKFVIPNSENLYLCDAPTPSLFDFSFRTFNYTSISIEEPKKLARYIINQKKWDLEAIESNMDLEEPFTIIPEDKIPVFVTYMTSIIDDRGNLIFSKDIYEYDKRQAELMGIDMTSSTFNDSFSE